MRPYSLSVFAVFLVFLYFLNSFLWVNEYFCPLMLCPSSAVSVKSSWFCLCWFTAQNNCFLTTTIPHLPRDPLIYQTSKLRYCVTCKFWIGELFTSFSLSLAVRKQYVKSVTWRFLEFYCTKPVQFNSLINYYWLCSDDEAVKLSLETVEWEMSSLSIF